jgi:soluble lytic murein transglycosylase
MIVSFPEKTILVFVLISFMACAAVKTPVPDTGVAAVPGPAAPRAVGTPLSDPGQGLKSALEAYKAGKGGVALSLAWRVREHYPDTPWYRRSLFLTEQALIQMDRASEADAAMLRVQDEYPVMADYALFMLAEYHYANKRFSQAAVLYQQMRERYPRSSLAGRAAYRSAQALLESAAYTPAAGAFEKFLQDNPRSEFCADAGIGLGKALTADAEPARALRAYRDVQVKCPGSPAEPEVERALAGFRSNGVEVPELAPEELYERGNNLFRANQYDKAVETFTKLLALELPYPDRPEVLLRSGIALFNLGRRTEAATLLEKLAQEFPRDQRVPEALYWLGKSYSKLGERDKGVQTFRRILDSYSGSEWADDALFLTGNIYREADDLKKALTFYGRLAAEYPESKFADSAFWWKAWACYGAGEYRQAEQNLQELVLRYPKSFLVNQARYWQGRISEKTGNTAKAAAYYGNVQKRAPYTYYGYRAGERLAGIQVSNSAVRADEAVLAVPECEDGPCPDEGGVSPDTDDGPPVWTTEALKTLSAEPSFTRSLELLYLDMKKEAAAELSLLSARLPRKRGALLGLSKTFFELGDYYRSLMLVLTNYERTLDGKAGDTPQDFWLLAYPQGYWDSIVSYSRKYGQDPYFIAAIIRAESQFHAEALSPAGARGVMQVMPATGAWVAQMIRAPGFDANKLFDSDTAINIGTWYIGHLMKRFKGDALFTAAAYNAGPEAVSAWLAKNGQGAERDEFVESIPFSETRGYVKKVMRNYAEYKRIYGRTVQNASRSFTRDEDIPGLLAGSAGGQTP